MAALGLIVGVLPHIFLNPLIFMAYLGVAVGREGWGIVPTGSTNVSRMIPAYALAFSVVVYALWTALVVAGRVAALRLQGEGSPGAAAVLVQQLQGTGFSGLRWLAWAGFLGTALVAAVWIQGMEGNIMGFFGFPILLVSTACYLAGTYGFWGASAPVAYFSAHLAPARLVEGRGLWPQFLCFALLNPFLLWTVVEPSVNKTGSALGFPAAAAASVLTPLVLYAAWLALTWGWLRFAGHGTSWSAALSAYFGPARTLRGFQQLAILAVAAAALAAALSGADRGSVRAGAAAALYVLLLVQAVGAFRALRGARAALTAPAQTAARPPG